MKLKHFLARGIIAFGLSYFVVNLLIACKAKHNYEPIILETSNYMCQYEEVMLEVSYYCPCEKCCDVQTGITASGEPAISGITVAMPPNVPFGTQVYIEQLDHVFTVQDRGGYIQQLDDNTMRVDVYVNSHELALDLGRHVSKGILYHIDT